MYIPKYNGEEKTIIFTGAGCDAPSGLSTFRDKDGIWDKYDIDKVCNYHTWKKNYNDVHNFYNKVRNQVKNSKCNEYHYFIKELYNDNTINITTNISDFFDRLKIPTMYVHGKINEMNCENCGNKWNYYDNWQEDSRCPKCDSHKGVKPNVIFFNEGAWLYSYMRRAFEYLQNPNSKLIVIGSSSQVINIDDIANISKGKTYLLDKNYKDRPYDYRTDNLEELKQFLNL